MRNTTRCAAGGTGGGNSRSSKAPKASAGSSGAVAEVPPSAIAPRLDAEITNRKDRVSPATMKESQAAWLGADGFGAVGLDRLCW
jgi:hypothetical protein